MGRYWKKSWGTKIRQKNEPDPPALQRTFLFDVEVDLAISLPRFDASGKENIARSALTVMVARFMAKHPDWSCVGSLLLNRLRKYIQPSEHDWKFDIREGNKEYWKLETDTKLCRHCAPLHDHRNYPNEPMYDELTFDGVIGRMELTYTMKLFLGPAIFGAMSFYESKGFPRTSPWYENDADENNLSEASDKFSGADEALDNLTLQEHSSAWYTLGFESSDDNSDDGWW